MADPRSAAIATGPDASAPLGVQITGTSPPDSAFPNPSFTFTPVDNGGVDRPANGSAAGGLPTAAAAAATSPTAAALDVADDHSHDDRRNSAEWDASKVPPSRFQKRKGSIFSTPGSRDGHVDNNYAAKFHAKHAELGYNKK